MSDRAEQCIICDKSFDRLRSLHLHCVQTHPKKFICCPICYRLFITQDDFVNHSNSHHERSTKKNTGLKEDHYKPSFTYTFDGHMVNDTKCMACWKRFSNSTSVRNHYKHTHLMVKYLCHHCPQTYSSLQNLKYHYRSMHGLKSTIKCIRTKSSRRFAGFNLSDTEKARSIYMKMNGIHNQGAVRRLKISNRHTIGTKASTRIAKWTIEMNDDNFLNEKPSQRLTYCNQNGFVKLFAHKMNDLDETSEQA